MQDSNDHTSDVEKRLMAIKIEPEDTCAFFDLKIGSLNVKKECWNCRYAEFDTELVVNQNGLCKFKRKE